MRGGAGHSHTETACALVANPVAAACQTVFGDCDNLKMPTTRFTAPCFRENEKVARENEKVARHARYLVLIDDQSENEKSGRRAVTRRGCASALAQRPTNSEYLGTSTQVMFGPCQQGSVHVCWYSGFQASVEFCFKPRRIIKISPTIPNGHYSLRISCFRHYDS
jgi:hypothetical protein